MYSKQNMKNRSTARAFTLIELLVVIAIIGLLVSILMPALHQMQASAYKTKTTAAIQELSAGALQYKNDTKYYPGQKIKPSGDVSGSQLLAGCLLDGINVTQTSARFARTIRAVDNDLKNVKSNYISYSEHLLSTSTNSSDWNKGRAFTLSDRWKESDQKAILYFPSILGSDAEIGLANQPEDPFHYVANYVYCDGSIEDRNDFRKAIWDKRFGASSDSAAAFPNSTTDKPYKSDSFLLFGAGKDRQYFTEDDVKNFK